MQSNNSNKSNNYIIYVGTQKKKKIKYCENINVEVD